MRTFSANRKPLPELDIDPADVPLVVAEARKLPGVTDTVARNLGGWIIVRHAGMDDTAGPDTKARYRKILAQLADIGRLPEPPAPDSPELVGRRARRSQSGFAQLAVVGAVAGVGLALRMPPELVAGVANALTPRIDDEPRYDATPLAA